MPTVSTRAPTRAWVEVDLEALRDNLRLVRARVGSACALIPMVKADGYGLGAVAVARALEPLDPWGYGVATVEEGADLRAADIRRPLLVVAPLAPGSEEDAVALGLTVSLSDLVGLDRLRTAASRRGASVDVHVEVDTGMGRCGFDWRGAARWTLAVLDGLDSALRWTGIFTHFQAADDADPAPTLEQWRRFRSALDEVAGVLAPARRSADAESWPRVPLMVHAANSAAALRFPRTAADAVRPGIVLYGARITHPGGALADAAASPVAPLSGDPLQAPAGPPPAEPGEAPQPRRVVAVRSRVLLVREVPAGATVGYGATHHARRDSRWATLGIGYGDGLPRALGNQGRALLGGRTAPIVGRVSMDLTVVDVTDLPDVSPGDVATLIGEDGGSEVALEEVARQARTITYEVLTGLAPRLPRVHREGAKREEDGARGEAEEPRARAG